MTAKRRALAERRQVVGHSQETVARVVGGEPTTVGRWERGETVPQPWCRPKLADALGVSVEELDAMLAEGQPNDGRSRSSAEAAEELPDDPEHDSILAPPWNHRGTVEAAVVLSGGDQVKRRGLFALTGTAATAPAHQWLVHEPGPLVSGLSGRRVSATLVDRLPAMIIELRTMDDVAGGGTVFSLAQHEFGWVTGLLDHASYDEPTGRKLLVALAELGQFTAWCAFDARQPALAQRYNIVALGAAHCAGDRPLGAHILGSMAKQAAYQGRPAEAVTLAETALVGVQGQQVPRLQAELSVRLPYARASVHDAPGCAAAILKARDQLERLGADDDPPWLYFVIPAWVLAEAGNSLLKLDQADRAAAMLGDGVVMFGESFARDQQLYLTLWAQALARPGKHRDLDAAAGHGVAAIELAESLDSTLGVDLLRDLYRQLKPYTKVPVVQDFLERARGSVAV